jgi:signal transduction histidine kinase
MQLRICERHGLLHLRWSPRAGHCSAFPRSQRLQSSNASPAAQLNQSGDSLERAVQSARLDFAFNGLPTSLMVSVLLAGLTATMLRGSASAAILWSWFSCLAAVNGMRLLHYSSYRSNRLNIERDLRRHDRQLLIGCFLGGAIWGGSALLFLPKAPELQFFLAFVIAGVSSGAVSSLSVAPQAAYAFVLPCVLPLTVRFISSGDAIHTVMGIMTGLYMLFTTMVARRGHLQLTHLVSSRLEAQSSQAALESSESQRRVSDERLRIAAEAGQIGVWELDLKSKNLVWDERMYRLYCIDPASAQPHYDMWRLRLHPVDLAPVERELAMAIDGPGDFKSEFRILLPSGEERFIKAAATVSRDASGRALRMTGINLDITELRRLERIKSEFVSVVSHELRTPLTSIRGSLGLLINETAGPIAGNARELLRVAERNAQRLGSLIDDLLDVEKLEAGKLRLDVHVQTLRPLIEQALEANAPYAKQHDVRLELAGEHSAGVRAAVDAKRIAQVLTNLLSNAIKFSPGGSAVSVYLGRPTPDRVRVEVRDSGPGIAKEFRARIFTKFSQSDASDARLKGGTGLGLAISKGLIEQMGGIIGFEVPDRGGTHFFFELPVAHAGETGRNSAASADAAAAQPVDRLA